MRAVSFIVELREHFQRIVDLHLRHEIRPQHGEDVRLAVHGNYNIYFRFVGADLRDVQIIRVLNAARRIEYHEIE